MLYFIYNIDYFQNDFFSAYSFWWFLFIIFISGIGLSLTPCVYSLLPITISYFSNCNRVRKGYLIVKVIAYWLGITVMNSALGTFISLTGGILGQMLNHSIVIVVLTGIMLFLALSMFDFWELRLPIKLNYLAVINYQGVMGAFLMGLSMGVLVAPCIGPFILGLMTHVALVGKVYYGLVVFLSLSAGLGLPFALLAIFSGIILHFPKVGVWMVWVRKIFGIILIIMAINMLRPLIGEIYFKYFVLFVGIVSGFFLWFIKRDNKRKIIIIKRIIALFMIIVSGIYWWVAISSPIVTIDWKPYTPTVLLDALIFGRPVVIDFTASWCQPCRQMDDKTFSNPEVTVALKKFETVRIDLSSVSYPCIKEIIDACRIRGVPTLAFFDNKGMIIPELTLVGFEEPENFLYRLRQVLARSSGLLFDTSFSYRK